MTDTMSVSPAPVYLMNNYGQRTVNLVRGEGVRVWDDRGNEYLDALMGIAVCGLGHCHPAVTKAITDQASTLVHCSNLYGVDLQAELARRLCSVTGMDKVFFSNSGAEANEAAIKLARLHAHHRNIDTPCIVTFSSSFHGRTLATLSATANDKVKQGFGPLVERFRHLPFNDIEALQEVANCPNIVAVMIEPVQGEGGINIATPEYLQAVRALCDQNNWLLIFDEIQTGNGRTGTHFASEGYGVQPDIMTTAKGLGNGVPIGACMARGEAAELFGPGSHGSTYGGNPLVCAASIAVFDTIVDQGLANQAQQTASWLSSEFKAAFKDSQVVRDVRHLGMMMAIEMQKDCGELVALAGQEGLLINVTAGNRVRLLPALNMSRSDAQELLEKLTSVIFKWEKSTAPDWQREAS